MIYLAIKHLLSRKRQSLFTLMGIFFGTAAFVIISGFFVGFRNYLTDQLVSGDAHIKITKNDEKVGAETITDYLFPERGPVEWLRFPNPRASVSEITNPQGWLERTAGNSQVEAVGFQYSTTALIAKGGLSQSVSLVGTEPEKQILITNIESKIIKGSFLELKGGIDRLVVGETLATDLAISVEDVVLVTSGVGVNFPMKVVGIYSSGNRLGDRGTAYTSLSTAQKLAGENGKITQVSIKLRNSMIAADLASDWKETTKDKVESWDQANASFLSIFQTQDTLRYATISILLLVAGFSIYNILNMVVIQKQKDIAILRSMGFDRNDILKLFLFQGAVLGLLGSLLGIIFGFLVCQYLATLTMNGPPADGAGGKMMVHIAFEFSIYLNAFLLGIGSSTLAAFVPSRSASRLTPIDTIRAGAE